MNSPSGEGHPADGRRRGTAEEPELDPCGAGRVWVKVWEPPGDRGVQPLMSGHVSAATGEIDDSETLPVTGTYTVLVEPVDAATGRLDLRLTRTG